MDRFKDIVFILTDNYHPDLSLIVDVREDRVMRTDITLNGDCWFNVDDIDLSCNHLSRLKRISPYLNLFQCLKCGAVIG